jgi:hypothetical protein
VDGLSPFPHLVLDQVFGVYNVCASPHFIVGPRISYPLRPSTHIHTHTCSHLVPHLDISSGPSPLSTSLRSTSWLDLNPTARGPIIRHLPYHHLRPPIPRGPEDSAPDRHPSCTFSSGKIIIHQYPCHTNKVGLSHHLLSHQVIIVEFCT